MANKKTNKKLPKDAVSNKEIEPKYGFVVNGYWNHVGGHHFDYANPDEPEKAYSQKLHASGNYNTVQHDEEDKEIQTEFKSGEHRGYTAGGKSVQVDGHYDHNGEKTGRMEHAHDFGQTSGKNYYRGTGKKEFKMSGDSKYNGTQQGSAPVNCNVDAGTNRHRVKGDRFEATEGDHVCMGEKKKIEVYKNDVSLYTDSNHDVYAGQKYHVYSKDAYIANTDSTFDTWSKQDMTMHSESKGTFNSKSDMTISSDSKITIQVGSSKITITSSKITIEASQIEVKASGTNDIQGHPLNFNGGGTTTTPFTLP